MFRKRRSSSQPPQSRNYNAQQGATSAAAIAFLTGQPQGGSGGNLSSAAAAAALRSQTATPTPIGDIQTKRMVRRGSTSSFGSNTGSVRQPFGGLQRAPSRSSMTERSFRSPSPGGRNRVSSISSDIPPLPTHNRSGSLEGSYRIASPEPAQGARSMSVDRASRAAAAPRRAGASRAPLANVPEEGRDVEDYDLRNRQSSINYSRPMSPTPSMSSYRGGAPARSASASGYYYDPATRKLVGKPPANASPAVKAARASAQQTFVPPPLPASYTATRARPASVAKPQPAANAAAAALTPAQLRAQHMRAGPPISVSTPVNRPRASSSATTSTQAARDGSSIAAVNTAQPARPGSALGLSSRTQVNRPGSSMGRLQTNAINSNTSLASTRPAVISETATNVDTPPRASMGRLQANAVDSNTSLVAQRPRAVSNIVGSNAVASAPKQKLAPSSAVSSPSSMSAVKQLMQQAPQSLLQQPEQVRGPASVGIPSPDQETMRSFQTRAAAMIAGSGTDTSEASPSAYKPSSMPQSGGSLANGTQSGRSINSTSSGAAGENAVQSAVPAKTARLANANLLPTPKHEPSSRSLSPAKSAMKASSIRTLSPAGSVKLSDSDSKSLVSDEGSSSTRKKKSVRISLTEDQIPSVPHARNVSAPLTQKGPWTVTDETDMGARPALPTFGSVRARNKNNKETKASGLRPLSNVYETDPAAHQDDEDVVHHLPSATSQSTSLETTPSTVEGLGLNGGSSNVPAFMRDLPGYSAASTSTQEAHGTDMTSGAESLPAIAVLPATPRVDEMPEEPRLDSVPQEARAPFRDTRELPTIDNTEHTRSQETVPASIPKQTFLSDFVRNLRPNSEIYDDRGQSTEDLSDAQTQNVFPAEIPSSRVDVSQSHDLDSGVSTTNNYDNLPVEEGRVNYHQPPTTSVQHVSEAAHDSFKDPPPRVLWPVGVSAPPVMNDNTTTMFDEEPRPQAIRLDNNPVPFDISNLQAAVAFTELGEHTGEPLHDQQANQHSAEAEYGLPRQQDLAKSGYESPPHSPPLASPPLSPAIRLDSNPLNEDMENDVSDAQPDEEDWERVRAYWAGLSERKKMQLEQEAAGTFVEASPRNSPPSAVTAQRTTSDAPLPPWPDHQYQQSVRKTPLLPPPADQNLLQPLPGLDPFPSPAMQVSPPNLRYEQDPLPQVEHSMPKTLRAPEVMQPNAAQAPPQAEYSIPRTLRDQDSIQQRQSEQVVPRTMRGPDSEFTRQVSNQGLLRNDRPMMRPASSSGPPPVARPIIVRPGSSIGPPPTRPTAGRQESSASSIGGRPASAAAAYPLKSALKKTNAPIAVNHGALQRNLSNSSDDSFTQNRMRRKESSGGAQGGRYTMRRSMRESATDDRVMSPVPINGSDRNGPGRMSLRSSMRDPDAPTLRNGPPGGRGPSNRASLRQQAPQPAQKMGSAPNMLSNNRGDSSDDEDSRPRFGGFRSRFRDSDDEDMASPPRTNRPKMFSPGRNSSFGGRSGMSAIKESPATINGHPQGAALSAGTLRGGAGVDSTPTKSKRATFSLGTKEPSYDQSFSAPTTPARPQLSERTSSLMRSLGSSTPTGTRVAANTQDYPSPGPMSGQYMDSAGVATDKKGNTAEEIARKMWEKQQKSGKNQLPIVSQRTGKKKKFQGLRRMLGIED